MAQSSMRTYKVKPLQSTDRRSNLTGGHLDHAHVYISVVQLRKHLLREVETYPGGVDGNNVDRRAQLRVGDIPAPAAIGRIPLDVVRAADGREGWNGAERRESRREAIGPVRACHAVHRSGAVVERGIVRGAKGRGYADDRRGRHTGRASRGYRNRRYRGRRDIGRGFLRKTVGNWREEECEDKGCEIDHCEKSRVQVVVGCH